VYTLKSRAGDTAGLRLELELDKFLHEHESPDSYPRTRPDAQQGPVGGVPDDGDGSDQAEADEADAMEVNLEGHPQLRHAFQHGGGTGVVVTQGCVMKFWQALFDVGNQRLD